MSNITRLTPGASNPAAIRDAAALYIQAGIRVLPTEANRKKPAHEGWQQQATLDQTQLAAMWPDHENYGVGLAMGRWANTAEFGTYLLGIDCDNKPGKPNGVAAFDEIVAQHGGDYGKPWVQITPSGGVHYVYQVEYPHSNGTGQLPEGIDVRGDGGQIIAAPTHSPSGIRRWATGHAPWDHAPGFAPDFLLDLLQPATPPLPPVAPKEKTSSDGPGEIYNSHTSWGDLLTKYGWRYLYTRTDRQGRRVLHWERPGQPERDKAGGTLCEQSGRWGVFYVWSSSVPIPANMQAHGCVYQAALSGPFALYTAMEHGGNFAAAAKQLAAEQREQDHKTFEALTGANLGDSTQNHAPGSDKSDANNAGGGDGAGKSNDEPEGYSFRFTNLGDYTGDLTPREPSLFTMENGKSIFYADSENMFWGASGCGKSWLDAFGALQQIRKGNRVLIIDYEMGQRDWVIRLRALGATATELRLVEYVQPQEPLRGQAYHNGAPVEQATEAAQVLLTELRQAAERGPISLVIIDGVTEMLSSNNLGSNEGGDIAKMWNALPRIVTRETGAAVVATDHINRNSITAKQQDAMPTGSQHKLSRITGAGFCAWASSPFSTVDNGNSVGLLHLFCKKDRHGGVGLGRNAATLELTPLPNRQVRARLLPFDPERAEAGQSQKEQLLAVLLQKVHKLNAERSQGKHTLPVSQSWLAREMTDAGYKMSKDTCKGHLMSLAERKQVRNAGAGGQGVAGDWVPMTDTSNLFTD